MSRKVAVLFLCSLLVWSFGVAGLLYGYYQTEECSEVSGLVVNKEDSSDGLVVYVIIDDNGKQTGYRVFVGPTVFSQYEVGDTYEREVCELEDYEEFHTVIGRLLELGLMEEL